jgi:phosphatidylserine/phosphatidylglycerophosphate/cardiolipin synthase-like enzyme
MGKQSQVSENLQADVNLATLTDGTYVFFSPRDLPQDSSKPVPAHLLNYAHLIDNAEELVCMIFPFNIDDVFTTVYREDKKYLRLLIFDKTSEAKSVLSNDIDLKVTGGAVLESRVEQWAKEETAKYVADAGVLYVHNKFFLIDPLGKNPVVVTGSANFSSSSILKNDENTILIKGDARVADIYLTEFNRLFDHFWPRYLQKILPAGRQKNQGFQKPLDEKYTWHEQYFNESKYGWKRKQLFINMKDAKRG